MKTGSEYDFDVIVVGGGHAGIEAAYASARMGAQTLLITLNIDKIGYMPCNPAIGGVGKGHIVFEISAFGGLMPQLSTQTYLQARMLNTSRGPAVQGLRLQIDKHAYNTLSKQVLETTENLTITMGAVEEICVDLGRVTGCKTREGDHFSAPCIVITTGTFLNGLVHIGQTNYAAGRQSEETVAGLSVSLQSLGLRMGRLKTGTPPRLLRSSIDFSRMQKQDADTLQYLFEFEPHKTTTKRDCYITHTNEKTHEIIRNSLHLSAMYSGNISGVGPRYCPSIEDKVARFKDKKSHHIFVEPESEYSPEVYPNGISTSLPLSVQKEYIRSIVGFEQAIIVRPGYAIEYDFVFPDQLKHTLEVKTISGLFLAGQINGTTGYEEAAGQGMVAGINAVLKTRDQRPFVLDRNTSYIGIMIDDLVTLGVDEPYRMFTSRAERRLLLRQDNVFTRLGPVAYELGLIRTDRYQEIIREKEVIEQTITHLKEHNSHADLMVLFGQLENNKAHIYAQVGLELSERALQTIHADIRYGPYLKREERELERARVFRNLSIPHDFEYAHMPGLSSELQQKLIRHKPETIAQAGLISGMTPAALALLIFRIKKV